MDNEWPPLKKCLQYKQGMIRQYLHKFDWEDDEDDETQYEYFYNNSDDEDEVPRKFPFKHSSLKKFLHLVRTTRGYDMNVGARVPLCMGSPFMLLLREGKGNLGLYEKPVNFAIALAIEHINTKTNKFYKHLNTLNVVDTRHSILLLTFTAGAVAAKKMEENPEAWQKKVAAAPVELEETFLAAVSTPPPATDLRMFEVLECFLKPQGPAPWEYEKLPECCPDCCRDE